MEKDQEIRKLVYVLRRMGRLAAQASWGWTTSNEAQEETAQYCVEQYNRILARLKELDPTVGTIFSPLPPTTRLDVVAIACRHLAAYYEEEIAAAEEKEGRRRHRDWGSFYETVYEAGPFKIFFGRGFKDLEELGRLLRECMPWWLGREEPRAREGESKSEKTTEGAHGS